MCTLQARNWLGAVVVLYAQSPGHMDHSDVSILVCLVRHVQLAMHNPHLFGGQGLWVLKLCAMPVEFAG